MKVQRETRELGDMDTDVEYVAGAEKKTNLFARSDLFSPQDAHSGQYASFSEYHRQGPFEIVPANPLPNPHREDSENSAACAVSHNAVPFHAKPCPLSDDPDSSLGVTKIDRQQICRAGGA